MISNTTKLAWTALFAVALPVASAFSMGGNLATKGEALLNDQCAKCHAIGAEDASKDANAKPVRELLGSVKGDDLGNAFVAATSAKHGEFKFEPMDAKAIGDYLEKLKLHVEKAKS